MVEFLFSKDSACNSLQSLMKGADCGIVSGRQGNASLLENYILNCILSAVSSALFLAEFKVIPLSKKVSFRQKIRNCDKCMGR